MRSSVRSPTLRLGCPGLVSISSMGMLRPIAAPKRSERESTKWASCFMCDSAGRPRRLDTGKHLLGQGVVLGGAARPRRKGEYGLLVGGTLLQANALRDRGLEDLLAEDSGDLFVDVLTEDRPLVVEGDHDAQDLQVGVGASLDLVDRLEQV